MGIQHHCDGSPGGAGKRVRRKWLRATQASLFTEAFERPGSLPPKAKRPRVQYCSYDPEPMARWRPRCFHSGDHRSSMRTTLSSDGECITASHAAESIFYHKGHGGATGPGLKSRSCRTARGTGGLVSRALGSALPRNTGNACFSKLSEPSVARTVIES